MEKRKVNAKIKTYEITFDDQEINFTNEVPNTSALERKHLNTNGLVRKGEKVFSHDILVGMTKEKPKEEDIRTESLLRAIFADKKRFSDVSFRVPENKYGVVKEATFEGKDLVKAKVTLLEISPTESDKREIKELFETLEEKFESSYQKKTRLEKLFEEPGVSYNKKTEKEMNTISEIVEHLIEEMFVPKQTKEWKKLKKNLKKMFNYQSDPSQMYYMYYKVYKKNVKNSLQNVYMDKILDTFLEN